MSDDIDWIARAGARAKGKRPEFFDEFAIDRLMSIVMALVAEVSVLRQRQDSVERLLAANGTLSRADIDAFVPDASAAYERGVETKAYIARVMRGVAQALEAMEADDKPVEEVSAALRDM